MAVQATAGPPTHVVFETSVVPINPTATSATGKHTIFGRISEGMKVIQRMGMVPTGPNDRCVGFLRVLGVLCALDRGELELECSVTLTLECVSLCVQTPG
ncbi:hypothetical protein BBJ28_00000603 [Nothophytophthora sp. Chile5]|nr:hypothetical protein BBJ28_00000603 [Nothophytophthora sp. Chile5]